MANDNGMGNGDQDGEKKPTQETGEKHCDCMMDADFDAYPKIFKIAFRVYGVDSAGVKHIVIEVNRAFMVGLDVDDIITQLKTDHINAEFNDHDGEGMYHTIGRDVVVHSVRYIGILNYMTAKTKKIFELPDDDDNLEES